MSRCGDLEASGSWGWRPDCKVLAIVIKRRFLSRSSFVFKIVA